MTLRMVAVVVLAAVVTAGCGGGGGARPSTDPPGTDPPVSASLPDCAGLVSPPPAAPPPVPAVDPAGGGEPLPDLDLPCLAGGAPVALERLAGPAVVNLWASWCGPCRDELPVLQRYADRAGGRLHVVGVVTEDTRTRAVSFAADAGVGFPALHDEQGRLLAGVAAVGLPATLFVDADGRVRHLRNAPMDDQTVAALAAEHLGVVLP